MAPQKILVGPLGKGLRNDVTPFNVDNDAFPVLLNAYQWRGRIKRKRGTRFIGRGTRFFDSTQPSFNPGSGAATTQGLDANGQANLLTGFQESGIDNRASLVPGSIYIQVTAGSNYHDTDGDGILYVGAAALGTVDYGSGIITLNVTSPSVFAANFKLYPNKVCLGLEPFVLDSSDYPREMVFDQTYSYSMSLSSPYPIHNVSFYYNPETAPDLPNYVAKSIVSPYAVTPVNWNLQDYQQIWTTNYAGAMWTTGGISAPFSQDNIGMPFKLCTNVAAIVAGPPGQVTLTVTAHGLTIGDWVFCNEFPTATITGINFQTGYVIAVPTVNTVTVEFPIATLGGAGGAVATGMVQYLTRTPDSAKDCIRWFRGNPIESPTPGVTPTVNFNNTGGWVNFCPPLTTENFANFFIDDLPDLQYYLVGARMIVPFKDRLLFLGPVVQASTGDAKYLQDTIIYSQNGTPYYTASFTGSWGPTTDYQSLLVPDNQTAQPSSFFENASGYGGFISAGYARPITSVSPNEDALIVGFADRQARVLYTGNDTLPFNFYIINSELGSESTFSTVTLDRGVLSQGGRGFVLTSQIASQRIDLDIPDEIFESKLSNAGSRRACAQRDFVNEWVYFSYPANSKTWKFPTRTLQYNYRDASWGVFEESYTTYGLVRFQTGYTWATIGSIFPRWSQWNEPWNAGSTTLLQPEVLGGNQQGFVLARDHGTAEGYSLQIRNISFSPQTSSSITGATQANPCVLTTTNTFVVGQTVTITGVTGMTELNHNTYKILAVTGTTVTISVNSLGFGAYTGPSGTATGTPDIYSPDHCLNNGDFITIENVLGTVGSQLNNKVFQVVNATENGFNLTGTFTTGTYEGSGVIRRYYRPFIQTKQFPVYWDMGRKTRIGAQMYLFSTTAAGQVSVLIYLSQNADAPYSQGPIVPANGSTNNSLIYSQLVETTTEQYIQRATNASLGNVGDGATLTFTFNYQSLFGFSGALVRGSVRINFGSTVFQDDSLGTFTVTGVSASGTIDYITGIVSITFAVAPASTATTTNYQFYYNNIQNPTDGQQSQIWHIVNTSLIGDTVQLGVTLTDEQMSDASRILQTSEVELHSFILDVFPSQYLA